MPGDSGMVIDLGVNIHLTLWSAIKIRIAGKHFYAVAQGLLVPKTCKVCEGGAPELPRSIFRHCPWCGSKLQDIPPVGEVT